MMNFRPTLALVFAAAIAVPLHAQPAAPPTPTSSTSPSAIPGAKPTSAPGTSQPAHQLAPQSAQQRDALTARTIAYFRAAQHTSGGWSVPDKPGQPHLPAITALVVNAMLMEPGLTDKDPAIAKALDYILSFQQPDGGIYDTILPSYNTAISISALARVDSDRAREAVRKGVAFLKSNQWGAANPVGVGGVGGKEAPATVTQDHPFFGGWGYGNRGRPDLSNTAFVLQAFYDAELSTKDEAVQRALIFLQRCQMLETATDASGKTVAVNDQPYAKGSRQGGFIYATAENAETLGKGQSFAGNIDETLSDGSTRSMLRAYGSVTYMGFKSYLFAGLSKSDPRVAAALDWIHNHYSIDENPGLGSDGYYYFLVMHSRAMKASELDSLSVRGVEPLRTSVIVGVAGGPEVDWAKRLEGVAKLSAAVPLGPGRWQLVFAGDDDAAKAWAALRTMRIANAPVLVTSEPVTGLGGVGVNWRAALVDRLAQLQNDDGSFKTLDDRWMENNPQLVAAYALLSLQQTR
jgi:squalene-hopene/tetraprenyl-beta-curcumene cyclase